LVKIKAGAWLNGSMRESPADSGHHKGRKGFIRPGRLEKEMKGEEINEGRKIK
jgi:hypothetical protein